LRIGLIDVDSKIPNLALMKLSAYHKQKGDHVGFFNLFTKYDLVYASKIFDFSKDFQYRVEAELVKGGSGYDLATKLPDVVERQYPDYSLYRCEYAMGFITRGCIRNCPFCIVPKKEGRIRKVADIKDFWDGQKQIMLLDNNLTAMPTIFKDTLEEIIALNIKVKFSQGLDIRLINDEMASLLSRVRLWKRIHFAWDNIRDEKQVIRGFNILTKYVPVYKVTVFVLIGFNSSPEEDLYRVEKLRDMGLDPFVMPFDKQDHYQKSFARWVNHKAIFKSVAWEDYRNSVHLKKISDNQLSLI